MSLVSAIRWVVAPFAAVLFAAWSTQIQAQAPFTVEHLLQNEQLEAARFEPGGRALVFEFDRPYREGFSFRPYARWSYPSAHRAALYVVDLPGTDLRPAGAVRQLFSQNRRDDYRIGTISPGGEHLSYLRATPDRVLVATCGFAGGKIREFGFAFDDVFAPLWISRTKLLFATISPERTPQVFIDRISDAWGAARDGHRVTASQIGSGRYAPTEDPGRGLVIVDARTGDSRRLATGIHIDREVSPDGKWLAAVRRQIQGAVNADEPVDSFRLPRERTQLILFDLAHDGRGTPVSERLDVLPGSIGWSRSGRYLAFAARQAGATWHDAALWTYDLYKGVVQQVDLGSSWVSRLTYEDYWTVRPPRFAWLQDDLVVEAYRGGQEPETGWVHVNSGATPANITTAFSGTATEVVGVAGATLLLLTDGKVWAVSTDGRRRDLTARLGQPVSVWRESGGQRYRHSAAMPVETLLLLTDPISDGTDSARRRAFFLNPVTGKVEAEVRIPANGRILDAAVDAHRVAVVDEQHNVGVLSIADANSPGREVKRFNEHLREVTGGVPIRLEHKGPDGRARVSWLLMPPGWRTADGRLATVVQIYPGKENWGRDANESLGALRPERMPQLLAAHGFAVLMPSMPLSSEVPRDSLPGLAESVLSAVDAAISAGYVEPDRLGIEGHSYGGYGVMGVIAQTNRFRAAIAMNGPYDLIGEYGIFRSDQRMSAEFGFDFPTVAGMESGQQGMGTPPWRDPQRYLHNSPLMSVERIKTPVMLIHGDLDPTVPITQSEEMFTALTRLNRDAVFVRYWGEGHTQNSPANIRDLWKRKFAWYREHLGPPFPVDKLRRRK